MYGQYVCPRDQGHFFLCLQLLHNKCDGAIGSYSGSVQQFVGEKVQGILSSSAGTMHQLLPKYKSV